MNKKQMIEMIFEKSEFLKDFRQCPYSNNVLKCHKDVKCDNCIKKKISEGIINESTFK